MFRKTMFALAAGGVLGAAALAPTAASAHPHFWGHFWFPRAGYFVGPGYDSCMRREWVATPYGPRLRWINVCY